MNNAEIQALLDGANADLNLARADLHNAESKITQAHDALEAVTPVPPPTTGDWRDGVGIATGSVILKVAAAERAKIIALSKEVGARVVRFDYGGSPHDAIVNEILAANLVPMLCVFGTTTPTNSNAVSVTQHAGTLFGTKVKYEFCNEVDLHGWSPSGYASFLVTHAKALRAIVPNAIIASSGLWKGDNRTPIVPPEEFCQAMIGAGAFAKIDAGVNNLVNMFGIHNYDPPLAIWNNPGNQWAHLAECRRRLDAAGLQNVSVSITEGGGGRNIVDSEQVKRVTELLTAVKASTYGVKIGCVFSITPDTGGDVGYELVRADYVTKRPAFNTFKSLVTV